MSLNEQKCEEISLYTCVACCLRKGNDYIIEYKNNTKERSQFKWLVYKKLKVEKFLELLSIGNQIPLYLSEKVQLNRVKAQYDEWLAKSKHQLQLGF